MNPITQGLIMTAIGMGLVFVAILALWWMMDVMVKLTAERTAKATTEPVVKEEASPPPQDELQMETAPIVHLRKAAAAAVAVAIQLQQQKGTFSKTNNADLSAWQLTRRSSILSQTPNLINRKAKGS